MHAKRECGLVPNLIQALLSVMAAIIPRQLVAIPSALFASSSSIIFGFSWSIPRLPSLRDLIPPFLLAVPKKKVSHSRKAMRSANKGLKDKQSECTFLESVIMPSTIVQTWFIVLDVVHQSSRTIYVLIATPASTVLGRPSRETVVQHPQARYPHDRLVMLKAKLGPFFSAHRQVTA